MYTVTSAARISNASFDSEFLNDAAVPWKSACRLAGICRSCCTLVIAVIALPSAAFGAKLKETVTAGDCPRGLMEKDSDVRSKWVNALSGTALLICELLLVFAELVPVPFVVVLGESALEGVVNTPE